MFAQTLNELSLTLELIPLGPLLVKAGEEPLPLREITEMLTLPPRDQMARFQKRKEAEEARRKELKRQGRERREREHKAYQAARREGGIRPVVEEPEPADMRFVLTRHNGRDEPYIPGASLKGVLRSHAERLARSLTLAGDGACNPFGRPGGVDPPCWGVWGEPDAPERQELPSPPEVYRRLCPICKLFGSPYLAGRIRIGDAYLVEAPGRDRLPRRDGVGIDRRRGAAADGAKYDFEYWAGGAFRAQVTVGNFELWQVGLVAHLLHDLAAGEIAVGFGTRRGLGRVRGVARDVQVAYCGGLALTLRGPELPLLGLGQLLPRQPAARYGFLSTAPARSSLADGVQLRTSDAAAARLAWDVAEPERLWKVVGPLWNPEVVAELAQARRMAAGGDGDEAAAAAVA